MYVGVGVDGSFGCDVSNGAGVRFGAGGVTVGVSVCAGGAGGAGITGGVVTVGSGVGSDVIVASGVAVKVGWVMGVSEAGALLSAVAKETPIKSPPAIAMAAPLMITDLSFMSDTIPPLIKF